ncbi:MAG: hypothetical protein AABX90_03890 [Nanoarchaeota archaeon]|mgnify:CR=1 FL=1
MAISYIGLSKLDELEKFTIKKLSERSYKKIERYIKNPLVRLNIKKQKIGGNRHRISLNATATGSNARFSSAADEWDIAIATHKVFDRLQREIRHKIKV